MQYGPQIVKNGLIRCWDAADYKVSRNSWPELAGVGDQLRQNNGFTTSNLFGGYWFFNLSGQTVIMNNPVYGGFYTGPRTVEIWMNSRQSNSADTNFRGFYRVGSVETGRMFAMALRGTTELGFCQGNFVTASDITWQTISGGIYDRWLLFTLSYTPSTLTWYINGQSIYSQTVTLSSAAGDNVVHIASYGNFTALYIASLRVYNIGLTASQVLQNYNATKGRFGL